LLSENNTIVNKIVHDKRLVLFGNRSERQDTLISFGWPQRIPLNATPFKVQKYHSHIQIPVGRVATTNDFIVGDAAGVGWSNAKLNPDWGSQSLSQTL
jgi:hypothetical protein